LITSSDKEYIQAKKVKQGKKQIDKDLVNLAEWISKEYKVKIVNIFHEIIKHDNRIKIGIAVESKADEIKFKISDEMWAEYNEKMQSEIAEKYLYLENCLKISNGKTIFGKLKTRKPDLKNIFVSPSAFEPLAKEEANTLIPEKIIENLTAELKREEVWTLSRCFESVTLFVLKDEHKEKIKSSEFLNELENRYFQILNEYDEFNYWKRSEFNIEIDSKQNFDENYESSWFYYYR
jgi:hypothetical protein